MKTRKLLYLALFAAITTFSSALLPGGQPLQLATMEGCPHCSMQLVAPTIALNQLFL